MQRERRRAPPRDLSFCFSVVNEVLIECNYLHHHTLPMEMSSGSGTKGSWWEAGSLRARSLFTPACVGKKEKRKR